MIGKRLSNIGMLMAVAGQMQAVEASPARKISIPETGFEPNFLSQSPDGRTTRQAEKRAAKQAEKDRRRAFRHSVAKQNAITNGRKGQKQSQQMILSTLDESEL
ncbi:hypothetical protein nACB2_077 [Acinetobacter phage nACB2]|nr:hypothetical protein nACB2_077 [Acinetobacter phage nACB2]